MTACNESMAPPVRHVVTSYSWAPRAAGYEGAITATLDWPDFDTVRSIGAPGCTRRDVSLTAGRVSLIRCEAVTSAGRLTVRAVPHGGRVRVSAYIETQQTLDASRVAELVGDVVTVTQAGGAPDRIWAALWQPGIWSDAIEVEAA